MRVAISQGSRSCQFLLLVGLGIIALLAIGQVPHAFVNTVSSELRSKNSVDAETSVKQLSETVGLYQSELQRLKGIVDSLDKQSSSGSTSEKIKVVEKEPECLYGAGIAVAKREYNGVEYQYLPDVLAAIPDEMKVVALLNRLKRPVNHPRVTHVIEPEDGQPEFDEELIMRPVKRNHGDTMERIKWRSSLSLDLVRTVRFVSQRCKYALWIEDDAGLPPDWYETLKRVTPKDDNWAYVQISEFTAGVLFNSKHVHRLLQYITHHFDEDPVDWTLSKYSDYLRRRFPEMSRPHQVAFIRHRGKVSSLKEAQLKEVH